MFTLYDLVLGCLYYTSSKLLEAYPTKSKTVFVDLKSISSFLILLLLLLPYKLLLLYLYYFS
jgi:hypothetical protein